MTFTWQGRRLATASVNGNSLSFKYNSDGIRTQKTVNGVTTYFTLDGSKIISQKKGNQEIFFEYDAQGNVATMIYNGQTYYYVRNLTGEILGLTDSSGNMIVEYLYDPWGEIIDYYNYGTFDLANLNPFKYKDYYYDSELGLYYLNSRYYDPVTSRFINADSVDVATATPMSLTDKNLFAYCDNNPICRIDVGGEFWDTVFDVVSLVFSVVDVCINPDDGWAWAGLVCDVVDIIPFVTGLGEAVKGIRAASNVVEAADTTADVAKTTKKVSKTTKTVKKVQTPSIQQKGWRLGDNIYAPTSAGNSPSWSTLRQRYWKNEALYNPSKYPNDIDRMRKGLAPIGADGFSMELHHPYGRKGANFYIFEPLTRTQHRFIHYGM